MKKNVTSAVFIVLLGVVVVAAGIFAGVRFFKFKQKVTTVSISTNTVAPNPVTYPPGADSRPSTFVDYQEIPVNVVPQAPSYQVADDLSNITNISNFQFSPDALKLLKQNDFVVIPGGNQEFFETYEFNTMDQIPTFVTTDSMLHNYHLFFDYLLKTVEQNKLLPDLQRLTDSMLANSLTQYNSLKGTPWENAAERNVAFFAVASELLGDQAAVPPDAQAVVDQELKLINDHDQTAAISPVMSMGETPDMLSSLKEDYTQYIPRGHYDSSDDLKSYFKAMMWYGRLTFLLKDDDATRSAILITLGVSQNDQQQEWAKIYGTTSLFVGESDDITPGQYMAILTNVYGGRVTLQDLVNNPDKLNDFITQAQGLNNPQINSVPIFNASLQPDRDKEIKGLRFMGQRFTVDASIMQHLIYRDVRENQNGSDRMLPKGLDIPAALGSDEAYQILQQSGDTGYQNYPANMDKMRTYLSGLDVKTWTQNLYWGWLYALRSLLPVSGSGYPSFMQNSAWAGKELDTFLGSWAELKHDTILYSKQSYAEMGGYSPPVDYRGYVEPDPVFYARLAALIRMTEQSLDQTGLLDSQDKDDLDKLYTLSMSLTTISEKELQNQPLTDDENNLIKSIGGQLEHFWDDAMRGDQPAGHPELQNSPAETIADVATDPSSDTVLEEGTFDTATIYVVVPVGGTLRIANGPIFAYYEFPHPATDRLTDDEWKAMSPKPDQPGWIKTFTGGTVQVQPPQ